MQLSFCGFLPKLGMTAFVVECGDHLCEKIMIIELCHAMHHQTLRYHSFNHTQLPIFLQHTNISAGHKLPGMNSQVLLLPNIISHTKSWLDGKLGEFAACFGLAHFPLTLTQLL
jgi:hypothetical protein